MPVRPASAALACAICGRPVAPRHAGDQTNPSFPFCSPVCKMVDLGRWLEGGYRVSGPPCESTVEAEAFVVPKDRT